jgi:parallel beta-helix repeat protein
MNQSTCFAIYASILLLAISTDSDATAQRTFVSVSGTSNASCSLVAPCRSFAQAIAATSAGGEIIVLDSGGYGAVTITKSVSIIAPPGIYAGLSVFSGDGITINAPTATVVLRGLSVNGQGGSIGIHLQSAARVRIENCIVSNMNSHGIYHVAPNGELIVVDTMVRDNQGTGIAVVADMGSAVLDRVRVEHSAFNGFYVVATPGSAGVLATVVDSVLTHNGVNGIWADTVSGSTTTIVVERSVISYNGDNGFKGTAAVGSQVATLDGTVANDNGGHGIWSSGGQSISTWSRNVVNRNSGVGLFTDGGAVARASGNAGTGNISPEMGCASGSLLLSMHNNAASDYVTAGGCYATISGI